MKKWIAAILMLLLLLEMAPTSALATVVSGKMLSKSELEAARALAGLNDGAGVYHNGMKLSASMNAKQMSGWLEEQLKGDLHSLRHVLAQTESTLATMKEERPKDYEKLMASDGSDEIVARGKELQNAAEDLRQTLRFSMDRTDENQAIIEQMTNLLSSDEVYDYEKIRYSERIRQAGGTIAAIRQDILDNGDDWLAQIDEMQSICNGTYKGTNEVDAAMADWMSNVFQMMGGPVTAQAKINVSGGAKLSSRLTPNASVLSNDITTVTVMGANQIGIYTDDATGAHISGIKVSIRDADGSDTEPLSTQTTTSEGWVLFDITNYTTDDDGFVDLYIEVDASGVKTADKSDKYRSFCIPRLRIQAGTKYYAPMQLNDGTPYIYKGAFNGYDCIYNERQFYYTSMNDQDFDIVLETRNLGSDDPTFFYTDQGGVHQVKATKKDGTTFIFTGKWKQILAPGYDKPYFMFGSQKVNTMLTPVKSVFDTPTSLTDWVAKGLGPGGYSLDFTIPGINVGANLSLTPDILKGWLPKVTVNIAGTVVAGIGKIDVDFTQDNTWKNKAREDYDKIFSKYEKQATLKNLKQDAGALRDTYQQQKLNFLAKGGITAGVFAMLVAKWDPEVVDNERHIKITGVGGVIVQFYIDLVYQTSIGPVPVYANLNINLAVAVAMSASLDFLLDGNDNLVSWSILPENFTLDIRLTISVELGVGVKGVASVWVKGAGYLDFTIQVLLKTAGGAPFKITGGASVSAGLTILFISFSVTIWKGGPWTLYDSEKNGYSLLDHYMPDKKNDDTPAAPKQPMHPQTYPKLTPTATKVFTGMQNTLDQVKIVSLGDDLYTFYIKDGRLHWLNVNNSTEGTITDALTKGKSLYPSIFDCDYALGNVKDFGFDVVNGTGDLVGEGVVRPDDFIAVTAVCANSFDDNGYPLEVENNVCVYTIYLWKDSSGNLVCSMNADESLLGFFRYAWIGGQSGVVSFVGGSPAIELATSTVSAAKADDGSVTYTFTNTVDVELSKTQKTYASQAQVVSSVFMGQQDVTTAASGKPDMSKLTVQNAQNAYSDADIASGAGDGYARVFHMIGPDQSWLAVSRANNGAGTDSAIEFYDPSMDVAGSGKKSVVLDTGNIESFAQSVIELDNDKYARVLFYTDDVGTQGNRYRLKSLYLMPTDFQDKGGNFDLSVSATSYDIDMPTNKFKTQVIGGAVNVYWLSSTTLTDSNGNDYDAYRVVFAVYDRATNTLSNASVCAEFTMPDDSLAVRELYLTQTGKGYLTACPIPSNVDQGSTDHTPLSLFTFETTLMPVIDLKGQVFDETLVCPCDFDDFTITMMNSGNMGATALDLEVVLSENGKETVVGTLHADCLHPENNTMQMGGETIVSGEKAFYRINDFDYTPQRRDWVINEANKKYTVQNGVLTNTQDDGGQFDYLTTDVIMPGALAAFKSTLKIPTDWNGQKDLEIRMSGCSTNTNWVGAMAAASNRNTISNSKTSLTVNSGTELRYVRDPKTGKLVLDANSLSYDSVYAETIGAPEKVKTKSMHDVHVHHRVYRGFDDQLMLSITFRDHAVTEEPIKLYAEVYVDDNEEPLRVTLPYYKEAVSSNKTHTIDMPVDALVNPDACQVARVVIHGVNIAESALSNNEFTLYLNGTASPLVITRQPRDITAREGETVSFSVEAAGGLKPYTYQWQVWMDEKQGWKNIKGAVLPTLVVDDITKEMSGRMARCIITDGRQDKVVSDAAKLTVREGVDTGDHSNLPLYLAVALVALALTVLLRKKLRKD